MRIAILGGTGEQGPGLALRWAKAGEEVIIGSRQKEKGEKVAAELNQELGKELLRGTDNVTAATAAEVVVLTVPYSAHVSTLASVKEQLQGKIFVDVSVPLDPENARRVSMPAAGSAAEEAQQVLGPTVKVVGALQNVSASILRDVSAAIDCDVLVCGDKDARPIVMQLVEKLGEGIRAISAGPLEAARQIEPITALLIRLNILNKVHSAGIRITGLPEK
ncbi:MAG TPA: NADPH-dependent F420 reductase [Candidatus Binatia bacterium]|nr:NADPH-dependent F420 reductase [Candidatus Binatia bacterium]